jgi:luciferase family oxidoreductase group 1
MAQHCEALGYHRFWVSEHHNHGSIVGTAPEVLLAAIAATTRRIRVGSAGVMLPHYSPFKVAEQFRVLDAIAPGRIDLGLGRAPGSDGRTAFALNPLANERPAHFPNDVRDLMAWVSGGPLPQGHPFAAVRAYPTGETVPEVWILGSSDYGAQVAAHFGLPYAFAWFFTDGAGGAQALELYRELYRPSERHPEPHAGLCVWALAAATEEEAFFHYGSRAHVRLLRDRGIFAPLDPPDVAAAQPYTDAEKARIADLRSRSFVGTATSVAERINELAQRLNVQEMAVVTWAYDEKVRRESYRLLAQTMGLAPAAS